jgi:hypothetical protein
MQYEHYLYLYRLSTRLRKRNASIMLETIVNAAEVTSALLLRRFNLFVYAQRHDAHRTSKERKWKVTVRVDETSQQSRAYLCLRYACKGI